ncbi:hypothetical protein [Ferrimonas marina]|uniref:hypothetical protein n=1 Tax=Ferrimonas marina TaxID=299255 RepID=UPI0011614C13|nr:hypothetical protein [Ferrimonas marina]
MIRVLVTAIKVFDKDISKLDIDSLFVAKLLVSLILVVNVQVVFVLCGLGKSSNFIGISSWLFHLAVIVLVMGIIHLVTKNKIQQSKEQPVAMSPFLRFTCWIWLICSLFVFPIAV